MINSRKSMITLVQINKVVQRQSNILKILHKYNMEKNSQNVANCFWLNVLVDMNLLRYIRKTTQSMTTLLNALNAKC